MVRDAAGDAARDAARDAAAPRYAEARPCAALAPWVECYWSIRASSARGVPNRVLPDGCADVIVDLGGAPLHPSARTFVVGAMRRPLVTSLSGRVDLFGVRFHPGGAFPFLGAPLGELTDVRVSLDSLWGGLAASLAEQLDGASPGERVARVEALLLARLGALGPGAMRREEELVLAAVSLMRRSRGGARVRDAAAALGVGERRLERAFDRCVGLSPKFLARVLRFRDVIRSMESAEERWGAARRGGSRPTRSWTAVALDAGYADQPHFVREFRALAGVTPSAWAAERRARGAVGFVQDESGAGA